MHTRCRREKLDHLSVERGVRQLLADKVSGNLVGLWLLVPEHLRLGTGDLLTRGAAASPSDLAARLALQLVKAGDWLNWQPMYHRTDSKIRVQAFYCLLDLSLLHYVLRQAQTFRPQLTVEKLQVELGEIQHFVLLCPALGGGPPRTATVLAAQSLVQKTLIKTWGLEQLA